MYQKYGQISEKILNKDFIKAVRGGGHRFVKLFHKIPDFFKGMLPLWAKAFLSEVSYFLFYKVGATQQQCLGAKASLVKTLVAW